MGRFSEGLRQEVEAHEAEVRDQISGLKKDGLVAWCRTEIEEYRQVIDGLKGVIDPVVIVSRASTPKDHDAALKLARKHETWHKALVQVVKKWRTKGRLVPEVWRDYILDYHIEIEKKHDGRGKRTAVSLDHIIYTCVRQISTHTKFKATRRKEGSVHDKTCAASIVAEAMGNFPGYEGVKKIWFAEKKKAETVGDFPFDVENE